MLFFGPVSIPLLFPVVESAAVPEGGALVRPTQEGERALLDEAGGESAPCEVFVEGLFVRGAVLEFVLEEVRGESWEVGVDNDSCCCGVGFDDFWREVADAVGFDGWSDE